MDKKLIPFDPKDLPSFPTQNMVKSKKMVSGNNYYPMTQNHRGIVIVLNVLAYQDPDIAATRVGADYECLSIIDVFTKLDFTAVYVKDFSWNVSIILQICENERFVLTRILRNSTDFLIMSLWKRIIRTCRDSVSCCRPTVAA